MRVEFKEAKAGHDPDRLQAEAEVYFEAGPLAGTKLVGFALWKGADGETYVTCPSRAIVPRGSGLKYQDLLQPVNERQGPHPALALKSWILTAYQQGGPTTAPDVAASVVLREPSNGPERLVSDAEMHFQHGPLDRLKLVGFALWRGADGSIYPTFPARVVGQGSARRFFDFVRSADGTAAPLRVVKAWIMDAFKAEQERERCHEDPAACAHDATGGLLDPKVSQMEQLAAPAVIPEMGR